MPDSCGSEPRLGRYQLVGAQVVVRRSVQVNQPLLAELHNGYRRESLRDRCNPKDCVLRDRSPRLDVGEAMPVEVLKAAVRDNAHRKTHGGRTTQYLINARL